MWWKGESTCKRTLFHVYQRMVPVLSVIIMCSDIPRSVEVATNISYNGPGRCSLWIYHGYGPGMFLVSDVLSLDLILSLLNEQKIAFSMELQFYFAIFIKPSFSLYILLPFKLHNFLLNQWLSICYFWKARLSWVVTFSNGSFVEVQCRTMYIISCMLKSWTSHTVDQSSTNTVCCFHRVLFYERLNSKSATLLTVILYRYLKNIHINFPFFYCLPSYLLIEL